MMKTLIHLTLGCVLAAPAAWAATPSDSSIVKMSLTELLDLEVVTSSRVKQKLSSSQSTVKVITSDDIRQFPATTLGELLKLMVPGMDVRVEYDLNIKTYIGIRGLSGDSFAKRILFLMDGRPLNYPVDGDFDTDMRFPVAAIKRIEVVRGPGSSLYGANAFQGTINIITGANDTKNGGTFDMRAGSYGNVGASAVVQQELAKDVRMFVAVEGDRAGEYGIGRNLYTLPSTVTDYGEGFDASDVKGRLSYKGLSLSSGYHDDHVNDSRKGDFVVDPANPKSMERSNKSNAAFGAVEYESALLKTLDFTGRAFWGNSDKETHYSTPLQPRSGTPLKDLIITERMEGAEAQGSWTPRDGMHLLVGGDVSRRRVTSEFDRPYVNGRHSRQGATFAEAGYKPISWLDLVAGGRVDWNSDFHSQFSPRISALAKFRGGKGSARASYGTAFRAPTFVEQYLTKSTFADMTVNPETLKTGELSASYQFSKLKATATFFHSDMYDRIVFQRTNGKFIYVNVPGRATANGLELETDAVVTGNVRLFANYSYQKTKSDDPADPYHENLVYAPENKAQGGILYASKKFETSLAGVWVGEQRDAYFKFGDSPVPAYSTFSARAGWRPMPKVMVGLTAKNLLDASYYDKDGQQFTAPGVATTDPLTRRANYYAPRTLLADVRFTF
jgi:outer membrane cobalamin receptor